MTHIDWSHAGVVTVWIILIALAVWLYLAFAVWVGRRLHEADVRQQEEQRLEDARRKRRLATLLAIAEEIEAMPEHEQQQMQRRAEMLGFMDDEQQRVS